MRHLIATFALLLASTLITLSTASPVWALDANEMFEDPVQEARAREIGRQLRCLKCRNQSIFDSNAGIAKDLRVVVRERMVEGDSDDEILTYVSERFGDYVLMKPPVEKHTFVLWLTPVVLMIIGGVGLVGYMKTRSRPAQSLDLSEADRAEAQSILNQGGQS